jgi:hypothetical protein
MKSELNWSYPSSPNACRAGMAKTGCWTVTLADGSTRHFGEYDDAQREFPAEAERFRRMANPSACPKRRQETGSKPPVA